MRRPPLPGAENAARAAFYLSLEKFFELFSPLSEGGGEGWREREIEQL